MDKRRLYHAGPYPLGATYAADIPLGMTLPQIGTELLAHGYWVLGGLWNGPGAEDVRKATEEYEDAEFLDFQVFALAPSGDPALFALAIESTTAVRNHGDPYLVMTLYLAGEALRGEGKKGGNLQKLGGVYTEAVKAMRSRAEKGESYPYGVVWDPRSGPSIVQE